MSDTVQQTTPTQLNETTSPEGLTTLNLSGNEQAGVGGLAQQYSQQMISSAKWFYWIAALSVINAIIVVGNGSWSFLAGLGITQIISGFAYGLSEAVGNGVHVIALLLNIAVAGVFVVFGYLGVKGSTTAVIIGLVIYTLDGLIFLAFSDWLPLGFHAFVIFSIIRGLTAQRKLKALESELRV